MSYKAIQKTAPGFTLVELLLYIALIAFTFLATSVLFSVVMETRLKQETVSRVEAEGNMIVRVITQAVRNATSVNNLALGESSSSTLSLNTAAVDANPTVFSVADGVLYSTAGAGETMPLISERVKITNILFQNLGHNTTSDSIRIEFTLMASSTQTNYQYNYIQNFYGTASIR